MDLQVIYRKIMGNDFKQHSSNSEVDKCHSGESRPLEGANWTYSMVLLTCVYVVNFVDREVVHILAEPIKNDLGLADWELGLLSGLAFALLYTVLGVPIAWLAERRSRPIIIGLSALIWSGFTLICSITQSFLQLVLARVGVGVGEAGCTPAAHSLIMDYTRPEKRASALSLYGIGAPLGGLVGMAFGGVVADAYGWRTAFVFAGIPGLILGGLVLLTLHEPRKALSGVGAEFARDGGPTFRQAVRVVITRPGIGRWLAAVTLMAVVLAGFSPFYGSFYLRNHHDALIALSEVVTSMFGVQFQPLGLLGLLLGPIAGASSALGMISGGFLADRYGRGDQRRYLKGAALSAFMGVPLMIGTFLAPSLGLSLALLSAKSFVWASWYGPAFAAGFDAVPRQMRAPTSAVTLLMTNLFGGGFGPIAVGIASDFIGAGLGSGEGLRWALTGFSVIGVFSAILFMRAALVFERDTERAR